ncbi:MAG: ammonium transporter [Candidatus Kapabacteria bacterium]|nr:ammonium transporter [Candidatus Kapabacteria bacterium]
MPSSESPTQERISFQRRYTLPCVVAALVGASALLPTVHPAATDQPDPASLAWMLLSSGLVLLMTPGLSFFYGGMVSVRNLISTMLQSIVALGVVSLVWYAVGFSLAFGDSLGGIIGNPLSFPFFNNVGTAPHPRLGAGLPFVVFAAFQLKFAIITPALITGSLAERIRFSGYVVFLVLFTLLVYCPLAHATWHPDGLLFKLGVLDFAGGTVVHISAGVAAFAGAVFVGRRTGYVAGRHLASPNVPYVILGTGLLWFGWFGFNAGSALAANAVAVLAFVNTNLASASAMLTWLVVDMARGRKPSAVGACIGAVVGLVAITPGAGYVSFGPALFIGSLAALISNAAVHWRTQTDIDDTLDVFPCHGVGGMSGMILTAVFSHHGGLITGSASLLWLHCLALLGVSLYVLATSSLLYIITNRISPLRVDIHAEQIGLDRSQHDEAVLA